MLIRIAATGLLTLFLSTSTAQAQTAEEFLKGMACAMSLDFMIFTEEGMKTGSVCVVYTDGKAAFRLDRDENGKPAQILMVTHDGKRSIVWPEPSI